MFATTNIDSFLLNKFQKFSDWSQDTFGVNNFILAKVMTCISAPAMVGQIIYFAMIKYNFFGAFFQTLTLIFLGLIFNDIVKGGEKRVNESPEFANDLVIKLRFLRLLYVFIFFLTLSGLPEIVSYFVSNYSEPLEFYKYIYFAMDDIEDTAFLLLAYFMSCTPKPPKPSKLKKLLDKAKVTIKGSLGSSETVPSFS